MAVPAFKIAAIVTAYHEMSHADVIVSRWLEPHPKDSEQNWQPMSEIASLYIDQIPEKETEYHGMKMRKESYDFSHHIGRAVAKYYQIPVFPTIYEALTLGGNCVAVDGVLLIGEHGDYPTNHLGQKLYPRKEFFSTIARVMRETGKILPLFNDKHLSWSATLAQAMIDEAKQLRMPLFAGSSIVFAGMDPEYPSDNPDVTEIILLFSADLEAYAYHSIEFAQHILDHHEKAQRQAISVTAYKGDSVWKAAPNGAWSKSLQDELLHQAYPTNIADIATLEPNATAFHIEYNDATRVTHIHIPQHGCGFRFGAKLISGETFFSRSRTNLAGTFFSHFACLNREIEKFFLSGCSPYPPERILSTTCLLADCMSAIKFPEKRQNIPDRALPAL